MAATPPDEEQQKSLLSEEEGVWVDTERKAKKSFPQIWQIFVYPIAVAAIFAMGAVSGYYWDDMDKHCSTYVSQPCMTWTLNSLSAGKEQLLIICSTIVEGHGCQIPCSTIQRVLSPRKHLSTRRKSRSGRGLGGPGNRL